MNQTQSIQFLKSRGFFDLASDFVPTLKRILKGALDLKKGDHLMLVSDSGFEENTVAPMVTAGYFLSALKLGIRPILMVDEVGIGRKPPSEDMQTALKLLPDKSIVMLNLSDRLGTLSTIGQSFRRFCSTKEHRFTTTSSLGYISQKYFPYLLKALDVDYPKMRQKHNKLRDILNCGETVRITSKAGTDIIADKSNSFAISSDGMYEKVGLGGNLPGGEVFFPPNKDKVDGIVVIDGSSRFVSGVNLINSKSEQIKIKISKGSVASISGGKAAHDLYNCLKKCEQSKSGCAGVNKIGEIGIGLNSNAKIVGTTIIDEKVLGTAHIALGSNYWFSGRVFAPIHLDQVFRDITLYCDGKKIDVFNL